MASGGLSYKLSDDSLISGLNQYQRSDKNKNDAKQNEFESLEKKSHMHKFYEKVLIVLRLVGSVELLLRSLVNRSWSVSRLSRNIDRLGLLVNRLLVNLLRRWAGLRLAWHRGVRFSFVAALAQANNETNGKNGAEGDPQPSEVSAAFRISRIGSYVFSERVYKKINSNQEKLSHFAEP
jgi:hypothetical protein